MRQKSWIAAEQGLRIENLVGTGAFGSPQLLQLSGIGPSDLQQHGINVTLDRSGVGENLQDHVAIGAEYRSRIKSTVNDPNDNPLKGGNQLLRYLLLRTGPFADNGNYSNTLIAYPDKLVEGAFDYELRAGMVLCVEALVSPGMETSR